MMNLSGYVRDHRSLLASDIWSLPPMFGRVWEFLRLRANWKTERVFGVKGMDVYVSPGMIITSHRAVARGVGYYERGVWKEPNPKTIKDILDTLMRLEAITVFGNGSGTVIYLNNWDSYQADAPDEVTTEKRKTDNRTDNQSGTNEKDIKKSKTKKKKEQGGSPSLNQKSEKADGPEKDSRPAMFPAQAWNLVREALKYPTANQSVRFPDPAIHAAIVAVGGWAEAYDWTEEDLRFKGSSFQAYYKKASAEAWEAPEYLKGRGQVDADRRGKKWNFEVWNIGGNDVAKD